MQCNPILKFQYKPLACYALQFILRARYAKLIYSGLP